MSEYQRYEILAIDHPLSPADQAKVRTISSRARITPTVFENEYNFGNFKGDPVQFLKQWYDVYVYIANWGTHEIGLGLPAEAVDWELAKRCCGKHVGLYKSKGRVVVHLLADWEEPPEYDEEQPGMAELSGVRAIVLRGDERFWYLCWLLGVQAGDVKDKEIEPLVPFGLGQLGAQLRTLADFLYIHRELLKAAAADTGKPAQASPADLRRFINALPAAEKNALLLRAAQADISPELSRRLQSHQKSPPHANPAPPGNCGEMPECKPPCYRM